MSRAHRQEATGPAPSGLSQSPLSQAEPLVPCAEPAIRRKFYAFVAERGRLNAELATVERKIRECRAAARLFNIVLEDDPAPRSERITVSTLVLDALARAGENGATVSELRPGVEEAYGGALHPKSIGVALLRLSKAGRTKRARRKWFAVP